MTPTATAAHRPRRSVLYMPAANDRALEKAKSLPTDAIIFDLEDAVAPDAKEMAREKACLAVKDPDYGHRELAIRINATQTRWHSDDIQAACAAGPDAIVVPKVSSAAVVHQIEAALEADGAPEHTAIWAMLETPLAMLHAEEIATASRRLTVLVMGTNDLVKELHAQHVPGRAPLITGLGLALLAARATGTAILDGVYNNVKDVDGFEAECLQGRQMGFDGKTLIHPGQVEPCNRAFSPSEAEVDEARTILRVWEEALAAGKGVATINGRMIENLHVADARRVLDTQAALEDLRQR